MGKLRHREVRYLSTMWRQWFYSEFGPLWSAEVVNIGMVLSERPRSHSWLYYCFLSSHITLDKGLSFRFPTYTFGDGVVRLQGCSPQAMQQGVES